MRSRLRVSRIPLAVLAAATVVSAMAVPPAGAVGQAPRPGAQGGGERLYPGLGNGGYDVGSYDVSYDYRTGTTLMDSSVDIVATAEQALSSFSLDSVGQQIRSVRVNGADAAFQSKDDKEKLVITPARPLPKGMPFRVHIDFVADRSLNPPAPQFPEQSHFKNWVEKDDGFALFGQPDRSHLFFPMNDIPRDKARATFRLTVPDGLQAVAGGALTSKRSAGDDRTTYVYTTRDPVPTDVMQAAVGHFTETDGTGPHGLPLRSFVATPDAAGAAPQLALIPDQLSWLEKQLGSRYPFETYGLLGVPGAYNNVALESATLSTFASSSLAAGPGGVQTTMLHELVHQYFGNAVSVDSWDDMWLSEGHASYYAFRYMEDMGYSDVTFDDNLHRAYDFDVDNRPEYGPPGRPGDTLDVLGGTNAGGVVMLDGLRRTVGDATFRKIEHTFFEKYRGRSATTQDYIDVAGAVSGKDLSSYIRSWIYGKTTPVPVGHPDWADQAPAPASAPASVRAQAPAQP